MSYQAYGSDGRDGHPAHRGRASSAVPPVAEVRERHDAVRADAHHLGSTTSAAGGSPAASATARRRRSEPSSNSPQALVDVGLHHRHAAGHAARGSPRRRPRRRARAAALADQVLEQRAVAAAEVEHAASPRGTSSATIAQVGRTRRRLTAATSRRGSAATVRWYSGTASRNESWPYGEATSRNVTGTCARREHAHELARVLRVEAPVRVEREDEEARAHARAAAPSRPAGRANGSK